MIELDGAVVRAANEREVVRRHDHRRAGGVDVADELEDAARGALVQVAGGLVGDERDGVVHQRPRDRDALLLTAGKLAGVRLHLGREAHLLHDARDPRPDLSARRSDDLERKRDVGFGRAILEQTEVLEDDAELATQPGDDLARLHVRRVHVADAHLPGRRHLLEVREAQDRALPGAARARQERELALVKAKGDVGESAACAGVFFGDVVELDHAGLSTGRDGNSSSSSSRHVVALTVSTIAFKRPMTIGPSNTPTRPNVYTPVMRPTSIQ